MAETISKEALEQEGYSYITDVPGQGFCGLQRMAFTTGLFCGMNEHSYKYRYCYHTFKEAFDALNTWNGAGHPDGNWIKRKGRGGDIPNENYTDTL